MTLKLECTSMNFIAFAYVRHFKPQFVLASVMHLKLVFAPGSHCVCALIGCDHAPEGCPWSSWCMFAAYCGHFFGPCVCWCRHEKDATQKYSDAHVLWLSFKSPNTMQTCF